MADLFSFKDLLDYLQKLTPEQKAEIQKTLSGMEIEIDRKDKSTKIPKACPNCGSIEIVKVGTRNNKQRYRCKDCLKQFTETSGTVYHSSRLSEWQWKELLRGMVELHSVRTIAKETDLSIGAVSSNKNKVMTILSTKLGGQDAFKGIVECDETECHLSFKGKRDPRFFIYHLDRMPRAHRSRAQKIEYLKKYGLYDELAKDPKHLEQLLKGDKYLPGTKNDSVCVLTAVDLVGNLYMEPVSVGKLESTHVTERFEGRFPQDAVMVTDGNPSYNWFAEERNLYHVSIPAEKHREGPYNLAMVNYIHSEYSKYYDVYKENFPPTKNLDIGTNFFWWLQKNKDLKTDEKVEILYNMLIDDGYVITYNDLLHHPLTLDTKGLIPNEV